MSRPGELSVKLKEALGLADGEAPPWSTAMQTYGPPPSNPDMKIPGLNAPPPHGAERGIKRAASV
eukprot:CAMPEP_0185904216 /NCGR_PEP_ID=MMETSP0196C-20130402/3531_1 /TAXON_ID=2932 /ORGANISM="Alexandrium fundyense, Strain CCMP1719" /LENGTH=64 /DNA_ID=CAMNT_0028623481 /DNA_START=58 /DNA_END=249 /DNA_ORIENTATION=+